MAVMAVGYALRARLVTPFPFGRRDQWSLIDNFRSMILESMTLGQ